MSNITLNVNLTQTLLALQLVGSTLVMSEDEGADEKYSFGDESDDRAHAESVLELVEKRSLEGFRREISGSKQALKWWYDEALSHVALHDSESGQCWTIGGEKAMRGWASLEARLVRFSLDGSALAAQVGEGAVEVVNTADSEQMWRLDVHKSSFSTSSLLRDSQHFVASQLYTGQPSANNAGAVRVLGLAWADHGGSSQDLVILSTRGADFYKVATGRSQCRHVRTLAYATRTYWYEPRCRLLALGTGSLGAEIRAYWLRTQVSDLPKLELPPPEKVKKFELPTSSYVEPEPVQAAEACACGLYGEAYFIFAHRRELQLLFYHVTKDKATLIKSVKMMPPRSPISLRFPMLRAYDNIIELWWWPSGTGAQQHQPSVQLFDLEATQPLVVFSQLETLKLDLRATRHCWWGDSGASPVLVDASLRWLEPRPSLPFVGTQLGDDPRRLVSFLLRRGRDNECMAARALELVAATARELMADNDLEDLTDLLDLVAEAQTPPEPRQPTHLERRRASLFQTPTMPRSLTQQAVVDLILDGARDVDIRLLADAAAAYLAALHHRKIPISTYLAEYFAQLLLGLGAAHELNQSVQFKVLPDSAGLCDLLLNAPLSKPVALDALHRLGDHAKLIDTLLAAGHLHQACRISVAYRHPLTPHSLLEKLPSDAKTHNRIALLTSAPPQVPLDPDALATLVLDAAPNSNALPPLQAAPSNPESSISRVVVPSFSEIGQILGDDDLHGAVPDDAAPLSIFQSQRASSESASSMPLPAGQSGLSQAEA